MGLAFSMASKILLSSRCSWVERVAARPHLHLSSDMQLDLALECQSISWLDGESLSKRERPIGDQ